MRILALLLGASLVVGCESDAKKAGRLERERAVACLPFTVGAREPGKPASAEEQAQCDAAVRNYNKFMAGR